MSIRDLIPRGRSHNALPATMARHEDSPILSLQREMNRLFDDVIQDFGRQSSGLGQSFLTSWPSVEVSDTGKEMRLTAELPGLEEKDVEVLFDDGVLVLRGEKRAENEDKDRRFTERFYGRFERRIPLGYDLDPDKINAQFRNGLLTVTLPRSAEAESRLKRIPINGQGMTH